MVRGLDYKKLSDEYEAKISELEEMLDDLNDEEPEEDTQKYDDWSEKVEDIEWLIDIYSKITQQCDYVLSRK